MMLIGNGSCYNANPGRFLFAQGKNNEMMLSRAVGTGRTAQRFAFGPLSGQPDGMLSSGWMWPQTYGRAASRLLGALGVNGQATGVIRRYGQGTAPLGAAASGSLELTDFLPGAVDMGMALAATGLGVIRRYGIASEPIGLTATGSGMIALCLPGTGAGGLAFAASGEAQILVHEGHEVESLTVVIPDPLNAFSATVALSVSLTVELW
jgi:hypothetical protein